MRSRLLPITFVALGLLAGCGDDDTDATSPAETTVPEGETTTTEPGDDTTPTIEAFTTEWGCGLGFSVSDDAQTWSLRLTPTAYEFGMDLTELAGTHELPSDEWELSLDRGTDLFANWCDDVIEVGEPVPEIIDRWSVRSGTAEVTVDASPDGFTTTASVQLTDLVVVAPWDEVVELGDIVITNDMYGFLAG